MSGGDACTCAVSQELRGALHGPAIQLGAPFDPTFVLGEEGAAVGNVESPSTPLTPVTPPAISRETAWEKLMVKLLTQVEAAEATDTVWLRWETQEEGKIVMVNDGERSSRTRMLQAVEALGLQGSRPFFAEAALR